jgi:sensor histidine kinase YesM
VAVHARVVGADIELRVSDDGSGIEPDRLPTLLVGAGGGIGLANVDGRLRATFGERYALRLESELGKGTTAIMTVPNLIGDDGVRVSAAAVGATG